MKSLIRKGLLILTLCALFIGIERLSHTLNGGFSPAAITSSLQPRPEWNITHEASDIAETLQALKQPYHYLGKGSQSFVFLSEDKKYVIKFFKHQRWRLPSMIEALPLPRVWEQKRERWK
ncbi:MAG: hypothetical protein KDK60_00655, partial [Chlamydiia bacterium]|nr:hypothetical protein [Chlamydiia bacterium]